MTHDKRGVVDDMRGIGDDKRSVVADEQSTEATAVLMDRIHGQNSSLRTGPPPALPQPEPRTGADPGARHGLRRV